jgi:hypothetical protein
VLVWLIYPTQKFSILLPKNHNLFTKNCHFPSIFSLKKTIFKLKTLIKWQFLVKEWWFFVKNCKFMSGVLSIHVQQEWDRSLKDRWMYEFVMFFFNLDRWMRFFSKFVKITLVSPYDFSQNLKNSRWMIGGVGWSSLWTCMILSHTQHRF